MLDLFASLLKAGLELVICISILRMYLLKQNRGGLLFPLTIGVSGGSFASLILFLVNKFVVRLEMGDVWISGILVASITLLLFWMYFVSKRKITGGGWLVCLFGFTLMLKQADPIWVTLYPIATLQNGFNSDWILQAGVAVASLILLLVMGFGLQRLVHRMAHFLLVAALSLSLSLVLVNEVVEFLQLLFGLQLIPLTMWAFDMLMPLVNNKGVFFYSGVVVICLLLGAFFLQVRWFTPTVRAEWENPAALRKHHAAEKNIYRWLISITSVVILMVSSIVTQEVKASRGVEKEEAVPVSVHEGHIHLDQKQIGKGLHLYSSLMEDGTEVRFIAVRKNGENFGIALDACEICGVAGYYEKDGQIICSKCNSVVNATTVGFKGGCNPIPIKYEQKDDGTIDIPASELDKYKDRFK